MCWLSFLLFSMISTLIRIGALHDVRRSLTPALKAATAGIVLPRVITHIESLTQTRNINALIGRDHTNATNSRKGHEVILNPIAFAVIDTRNCTVGGVVHLEAVRASEISRREGDIVRPIVGIIRPATLTTLKATAAINCCGRRCRSRGHFVSRFTLARASETGYRSKYWFLAARPRPRKAMAPSRVAWIDRGVERCRC